MGRKQGFMFLMTGVNAEILKQLQNAGLGDKEDAYFRVLPDLDHGLEWCEETILSGDRAEQNGRSLNLIEQLREIWPERVNAVRLLPFLERRQCPKGTYLIRQSERSESLYFIESGKVTVRLEFDNERMLRLRSMGPGTVVGEVGLFLGGVRTASVVTDRECTVYRLTAESLKRMCQQDAELALAFHEFLVRLLAERLTTTSEMLRGFQQ